MFKVRSFGQVVHMRTVKETVCQLLGLVIIYIMANRRGTSLTSSWLLLFR